MADGFPRFCGVQAPVSRQPHAVVGAV